MHNATLPKRSQIQSLQHLGPVEFLETVLTHLQEQKGYFEIDLIEMTQVCTELFHRTEGRIKLPPKLAEMKREVYGGVVGVCIMQAIGPCRR